MDVLGDDWIVPSIVALGLAFVFSLVANWVLSRLAPKIGLVDRTTDFRRLHSKPIPVVGGLAIFLAFVATLLALAITVRPSALHGDELQTTLALFGGASAMLVVGIWDDLRALSPRTKFLAQVVVASAVFFLGLRITGFHAPFIGPLELHLWLSFPVTILWFVGITNAFNLIDGADGVAGGVALFTSVAMAIVALLFGHPVVALVLFALTGAILAFLHFNFPPASVFLGDSGSLFLGFLLAGLGLASSLKATTVLVIAIPVVSLGLPVLDTLLAIGRRILRGERITSGDRGHIHHRLIDLGHSPRRVALILYGVCGLLALASLLLISEDARVVGLVLGIIGVSLWFGVQRLHIPEFLEVRRLLGRDRRRLIARNVLIRSTAARLAGADSNEQVLSHFQSIFDATGAEETEMWIEAKSLGGPAPGFLEPASHAGELGYALKWKTGTSNGEPKRSPLCEIRLPLMNDSGEEIGWIRVRRRMEDRMLPADLQLMVDLFVPEAMRTLSRVASAEDHSSASGGRPNASVDVSESSRETLAR